MTLAIDQPPPPRPKHWTKREYSELVEMGGLRGQRVYLFRGQLIERSAQYHAHAIAIAELTDALHLVFGIRQGYKVRIQLPFDVPGESMPEPDGLVCTEAQNLRHPHPNEAVLVVEVADSSLALDREKALEHAAARVPEYWIIDVNRRCVEVYRDPTPDPTALHGLRYKAPMVVDIAGSIGPLAKPRAKVPVAQFFH
jgi:Uma2 family endonuclease